MIRTIGSLVQETSSRVKWFTATSLYIIACTITSSALGASLASVGILIRYTTYYLPINFLVYNGMLGLIGGLAVIYAFSDAGLINLPRPTIMLAVPVTWWRLWGPYKGALAYGAALGLGLTTRIYFGAFYFLCAWCIFKGNVAYGAILMGTYGIARASILFPLSTTVYVYSTNSEKRLKRILSLLEDARLLVAIPLILFGTQLIFSIFLR